MAVTPNPLVIISSGRHGDSKSRTRKLIVIPTALYDEIVEHTAGPLNQVLVELIQKAWEDLQRSGKPLVK